LVWFCCWVIALSNYDVGAAEATDWMKPATWAGNYWGPAATRSRSKGQLPALPTNPAMRRWRDWGRRTLRDGDIVFRLGDARTLRGIFPLSQFIAKATGSPFSHTGIAALEDGDPVVYDCSSSGVQRQPFEVWMLDCVGAMGVKRLKQEYRRHIPGVIAYCRAKFEREVPFDYEFHPDDSALYCLELTEKAFRSQGLALSQAVRIGDWEHLASFPLTALAIQYGTGLVLKRSITLEQPVYLPGNEGHGVWGSPLLERVFGPEPKAGQKPEPPPSTGLNISGDLKMAVFAAAELRRSYWELPLRWFCDLVQRPRATVVLADRAPVESGKDTRERQSNVNSKVSSRL
jgi:hypothetical protein